MDSWNPHATHDSLKLFLASCTRNNMDIIQVNYVMAYVQTKMREQVLVMLPEELKQILLKEMWKWMVFLYFYSRHCMDTLTVADYFMMNRLPFYSSKDFNKQKQLQYGKSDFLVVPAYLYCNTLTIYTSAQLTLKRGLSLLQRCPTGSLSKFILMLIGIYRLGSRETRMVLVPDSRATASPEVSKTRDS